MPRVHTYDIYESMRSKMLLFLFIVSFSTKNGRRKVWSLGERMLRNVLLPSWGNKFYSLKKHSACRKKAWPRIKVEEVSVSCLRPNVGNAPARDFNAFSSLPSGMCAVSIKPLSK